MSAATDPAVRLGALIELGSIHETVGRDPFVTATLLLAATTKLKVATGIKAGGFPNHNETLVRAGRQARGLKVQTGIKAGGRSLNHVMQTAFVAWFYNGLAGINPTPDQPGFKHIRLDRLERLARFIA